VAVFAVHYQYIDDTERVAEFRPAHREFLRARHAEGSLLLSGPLAGVSAEALLIVRADSEEAALAVLDEDPFRREDIIVARTAREWNVVIGEIPGA